MGIRGLWKALQPAGETRTLDQVAVTEGFEQKRREDGCLIIGIDASIWMNQVQIAVKTSRGTGSSIGENPALKSLFYRLCRLLPLPIVPVFVFDGPCRPLKNRGAGMKKQWSHALSRPFQQLIEAFGYSWYTAPGEAEADLAQLNARGDIDAIISEDSDAMVFGARCVFRMKNTKDAGNQITVFSCDAVESHPDVHLDRDSLLLMAMLCGGDYDKNGLHGCGWKTALLISKTELAPMLSHSAIDAPSRSALCSNLAVWRTNLRRYLLENPNNVLGHTYPSLATHITDNFPPVNALLQYMQPITSWTKHQAPDQSSWCLQRPHLAQIGVLCEKFFSWGSSGSMLSRFKNKLYPGAAIRHLLCESSTSDMARLRAYADDTMEQDSPHLLILRIIQAELGPRLNTACDVSGYAVDIFADGIFESSIDGLDKKIQMELRGSDSQGIKVTFWLPASILQASTPAIVSRYQGRRPSAPNYPNILPDPYTGSNAAVEDSSDSDVEVLEGPCTMVQQLNELAPSASDSDIEFVEGPSPRFIGFLDLCTPSPEL